MMIAVAVLGPGAVAVSGHNSPGNNGTIKIHELGTPVGTESNDPKVCVFNVEGFHFDSGQTGYIKFSVQGGDSPHGTAAGPFSWGPADSNGRYDTEYFRLRPGHYKATLYGKTVGRNGTTQVDEKAKSKVFKVTCEDNGGGEGGATPTPTPKPTPTPCVNNGHHDNDDDKDCAHATPTPTPGGGGGGATPTPTPGGGGGGATPTPTPGGGQGGATPTPTPAGGGGGAGATPTPVGGVQGATGTPSTTLPPTDTAVSGQVQPVSDSWRTVLIAMAALLATVLLLTPVRTPASRLPRRR